MVQRRRGRDGGGGGEGEGGQGCPGGGDGRAQGRQGQGRQQGQGQKTAVLDITVDKIVFETRSILNCFSHLVLGERGLHRDEVVLERDGDEHGVDEQDV